MSKLLTPGELLDLTGSPQHKRQLAILRDFGLHPIVRPDESIAISWDAVNSVMSDATVATTGGRGANWGAMDRGTEAA
jgi:hypothetical protein